MVKVMSGPNLLYFTFSTIDKLYLQFKQSILNNVMMINCTDGENETSLLRYHGSQVTLKKHYFQK